MGTTTTTPSVIQLPSGSSVPSNLQPGNVQSFVTALPRSQFTSDLWAVALIIQLQGDGKNVPLTLNNITNIQRWMGAEEPASSWLTRNNPLNTSVGTTSANGTGSFPTITAGVQATAKTIEQPNMAPILAALSQNATTSTFSAAVVASPWASGHYGGSPSAIADTPALTAFATGTGGNPTGALGQLSQAGEAATGTTGAVNATTGALSSIGTLASDLTDPTKLRRVGVFVLGAALFGIGLAGFIATSKEGQKVISQGESAAAVAAVA